jgi:hypothetical protein
MKVGVEVNDLVSESLHDLKITDIPLYRDLDFQFYSVL